MVESDNTLREQIVSMLSGAGYEVSLDYLGGMKSVFAFEPDGIVLGADPPRFDSVASFPILRAQSVPTTYGYLCYLLGARPNEFGA